MKNKTILQAFEWYLPEDCRFWNNTARDAQHIADLGFTDVWLPPAYKGHVGIYDVGYGVYDLYDLGEFNQKGGIPTKYGTKDEYLAAIRALQAAGLKVIGDIVMNHRMGGDDCEIATVTEVNPENHLEVIHQQKLARVRTVFTFPGRNGKYSTFTWNKNHFNGIDRNELLYTEGILKIQPHTWNLKVSREKGNYDYLMGCNADTKVDAVKEELKTWGKWYMDFTGLDGVRMDAVKHIGSDFMTEWIQDIRAHKGQDVFAVGEYWMNDTNELLSYLHDCQHCMTLFDVPLHYTFCGASKHRRKFNMTQILDNSLLSRMPEHAVTFVDNHDTEPKQALQSWVKRWFKPLAYALILLRDKGTPCVFFGDLYGLPKFGIGAVPKLPLLVAARQEFAYGDQVDYFDHPNTIGWTRGDSLAVVMSNGSAGWKDMKLGHPGQVFVDLLGNRKDEVVIDGNGIGHFTTKARRVSVWIPKDQVCRIKQYTR